MTNRQHKDEYFLKKSDWQLPRAKPPLSLVMSELVNSLTINGRLPTAAQICFGSADAVFDLLPVTGIRNRRE